MTVADTTQRPRSAGAEPPPAEVPGNRWSDLEVAGLGAWRPSGRVSVVVTGEDPRALCPLTLASLAAQTYPAELTEVIVDEATGAGHDALAWAGEAVAARIGDARDEGDAEIVVLIEAGSIADPRLVEAHARWHHAVADAVSVGRERRVDVGALSGDQVTAAGRSGGLETLLAPQSSDAGESPVDAFLVRTRELTERHHDRFWIAAQASIGMRWDTLRRAGSWPAGALGRLGRLDLAWRLEAAGSLFVPDREALTYEAYGRCTPTPRLAPPLEGSEDEDGELGRARAEALVPSPGYRRGAFARRHKRPALEVRIAVSQEAANEVLEAVDAVLGGRFADLELRLSVPPSHPSRELIEEAVASDPRIVVDANASAPATREDAGVAAYVELPIVAHVDERTIEDLYELLLQEEVGALHVTVPGEVPRNAMVEVRAAGPLARARRVAARRGEDAEVVLGRLFGERWISGVEVSIRRRGAAEPQVTEHGPLAQATDLEHERTQHLRHLSRAQNLAERADRVGQRAVEERLRAWRERRRADRIERALADAGAPPWYWGRLRLARRARGAFRGRR